MSAEIKREVQLEIAHVLFIDIVGYSKLLINAQRALVETLNQIVRGTDQFRAAEATSRLIKIPTGDGMALVFYNSPEAPIECALEISRALKEHPELRLRMGVHSGPVSGVVDVNQRANVAGGGINVARRVMDCGDAGHILLSKRVAEDLEQYAHWQPHLHDLGECEVKHGVRISVVNLYTEELGNPEVPEKFSRAPVEAAVSSAKKPPSSRKYLLIAGLIGLAAVSLVVWHFVRTVGTDRRAVRQNAVEEQGHPGGASLPIPEKSIAVLPFANLSKDEENAFFSDGMQDEILTDLAKIADLKVISRTSVQQYRGGASRNIREIAQALGVAHILEGSVQRAGNKVRVSAQLIDARKDAHMWAEVYDRTLADAFAIQSEIARTIAEQLHARLSPRENAAITAQPTANLEAYDLYLRANQLVFGVLIDNTHAEEKLTEAVDLLDKATGRDPDFVLAYCRISQAHLALYWLELDHTPGRLALADAALQKASRLQPDSGEVHFARGWYFYQGVRDYESARRELALAQRTLPNNADLFMLAGSIDRREGRWDESTRKLQRAVELDPHNLLRLQQLAGSYHLLRRYSEEAGIYARALAIMPKDKSVRVAQARLDLDAHADTRALREALADILAENPDAAEEVVDGMLDCALCERDRAAAERALAALSHEGLIFYFRCPRAFVEGLVARSFGDIGRAQIAFANARREQEKIVHEQPDYAAGLGILGLIDAGLGQKEEAIREGERACELLPLGKDAVDGAELVVNLALIYTWTGEKDRALKQLATAVKIPATLSYGFLKLHPQWDSLRGDPRFERIVALLAPKDVK